MRNPVQARVHSLLRSTVVWDNHTCLPMRADESFLPKLKRFHDAGVTLVSVNAGFGPMPAGEHVRLATFMRDWLAARSETYCLVRNVEDVSRCKSEQRLGVVFDVEGMCPVQDDVSLVTTLYDLGVRWMLVAYNHNNKAGGGCLDEDRGLTDVGRAIIDEMERVGMVLCLSHTGPRTCADALEYCRNPPIFSHSNPAAVTPHARNVSDRLIRACAAKGGVVGLSGIGPYLGVGRNLLAQWLKHAHYVIDLVGPKHVGIGLDFVFDRAELEAQIRAHPSMYPNLPTGMPMIAPEDIYAIANRLARDNLTDEEIQGILGHNWLRVASAVWR